MRIGTIIRCILAIAAVALVFAAVRSFGDSREWNDKFDQWLVDEPVSMPLDLSIASDLSVPFTQSCSIAHEQGVYVELTGAAADLDFAGLERKGASGELRVVGEYGTVGGGLPIHLDPVPSEPNLLRISSISGVPNGAYTLEVSITSPEPRLAGIDQRLFVRNQLCGLEKMPAAISLGLGIIESVIAIVLALIVAPAVVRAIRR